MDIKQYLKKQAIFVGSAEEELHIGGTRSRHHDHRDDGMKNKRHSNPQKF